MVFGWFNKSPNKQARDPAKEAPVAPPRTSTDAEIRRENRAQLMDVVRECMITAGILSAGYKFKVLEADNSHHQFLILFDLASVFHSSTERLSDLEIMIQQSARHRYGIEVKTCYWRVVPDLLSKRTAAAGVTAAAVSPVAPEPAPAQPDPKALARAQLEEMFTHDPAADDAASESGFAPTQFSHSLSRQHGRENKDAHHLLLTGFEETELANSSFKPSSLTHKNKS